MADRYWVGGSGNWSDTARWSTTSGGSGGASVPSTSDSAFINGSSGTPTITINQDVSVIDISVNSAAKATINNTTFSVTGRQIFINNGSTLNMGSGVWTFSQFSTGSLGAVTNGDSSTLIVSSWPAFTLIRVTTNTTSRLNEVVLAEDARLAGIITSVISDGFDITVGNSGINTLQVNRLVLSNMSLFSLVSGTQGFVTLLGSNQLVAASSISVKDISLTGLGVAYAGGSSIDLGNNTGWTFADAPLVETFQDTFTGGTIDSAKWSTTTALGGTVTQGSGVITLAGSGSSSSAALMAKEQFVLEGSDVRFKLTRALGGLGAGVFILSTAIYQYGISARRNIPDISFVFSQTSGTLFVTGATSDNDPYTFTANDVYLRFRESAGVLYFDGSLDGINYTNRLSFDLATLGIEPSQILARPRFEYQPSSGGSFSVDDFNLDLTPTTDFVGTPTTITRGSSVSFTDLSNFTPDTWSWTFGDATTSTVQNPSKTYSLPGLYTVALTSSNSLDSDSESKTNYITVNKVTASTSIDGTFLLGGDIDPKAQFKRSIDGTFLLGGEIIAIIDSDSGKIERKTYMYKVYDEDNNFVSVLDDVLTDPTWSEEINRTGSTVKLELGRNSDSLVVGVEPLLDSDGDPVLDDNNSPILTTTLSRNKVGAGSNIAHNYRVDIFAFYGAVSPIQDSDELNILDNNNDPILGTEGAPNGVRRFTGFISEINIRYGDSETTEILLMSYGYDLDQYLIKSGSNTTVTYSSINPSNIVRSSLDSFASQGSPDVFTTYNTGSIQDTATTTTLTFRANTIAEVIQKALEASPAGWFYYVDLGNNLVNFRERSATADHTFLLGKHIKSLDLRSYIGDVVNQVLFTGGGSPASPFKLYTRSVGTNTRRGLNRISDARVTVTATADAISNAELDTKETVQYRSTVTILSEVFDIETINVGDTVQFRNFDNFVDNLTFQIVAKTYTPDFVTLQLDTLPRNINRVIDNITRQLEVEQNTNVPSAPTV